jgi:hypothetical protein
MSDFLLYICEQGALSQHPPLCRKDGLSNWGDGVVRHLVLRLASQQVFMGEK